MTEKNLLNISNVEEKAIAVLAEALKVSIKKITDVQIMKAGMTNKSFSFRCKGKKYICRVPGIGTDRLISRAEEAEIYRALHGKEICDDPVYMNPDTGYKITPFFENTHNCDPFCFEEVEHCMAKLREFHSLRIKTSNTFDIFKQIEFYEELREGKPSCYEDYLQTKSNVYSLKHFIDKHAKPFILTHIDAVSDNFIIDSSGRVRLIDWEYAGMQDPDVDLAMFAIYAMYDRTNVDRLISSYYTEGCEKNVRIKIYCYIAACGLLWSNWCEYKHMLGTEFGVYALRQYEYAKDYYLIASEEIAEL